MEIKEGTYQIPDDMRAIVQKGGKEILVKKRIARSPRLGEGEYRCRDCAHFVQGKSMKGQWYTNWVCHMKPKATEGLYYACLPYGKPCEHFEKTTKDRILR